MTLTDLQITDFERDGYLFVEDLFTQEEVGDLQRIAKTDKAIADAGAMEDGDGGASKIWLTQELDDSIYSAFAHCKRIVGPIEQLFNDRAVHYHHKMMLKEPEVGGAWEWHQDYGYWYNDGFLFPDMISCMTAVDEATTDNGCLQVLKGSHLAGRIEHGQVGHQTGALTSRVESLKERLELVHCEMKPGTSLFFHGNLLHCSAQNKSPNSRWSLICCYYANRNQPTGERQWVQKKDAIDAWDDHRILEIAAEMA